MQTTSVEKHTNLCIINYSTSNAFRIRHAQMAIWIWQFHHHIFHCRLFRNPISNMNEINVHSRKVVFALLAGLYDNPFECRAFTKHRMRAQLLQLGVSEPCYWWVLFSHQPTPCKSTLRFLDTWQRSWLTGYLCWNGNHQECIKCTRRSDSRRICKVI